ncbi:MAG: heme-binding domain-containing protein [Saprospiraceae bacterium]
MKKKYILYALAVIFILIQFKRIDKTNPEVVKSQDLLTMRAPSQSVAKNIKTACYDCHSNESTYPWYTNIAPVSWWIKGHIVNGREHLNFSNWGSYSIKDSKHIAEECVEMIEKNWMPLIGYKLMHSEAKLDEKERGELIKYFKTLK